MQLANFDAKFLKARTWPILNDERHIRLDADPPQRSTALTCRPIILFYSGCGPGAFNGRGRAVRPGGAAGRAGATGTSHADHPHARHVRRQRGACLASFS